MLARRTFFWQSEPRAGKAELPRVGDRERDAVWKTLCAIGRGRSNRSNEERNTDWILRVRLFHKTECDDWPDASVYAPWHAAA